MSTRVSNWAWSLEEVAGNEFLALLALADDANDDGFCWRGQAKLTRKARQSESTLRRSLRKLEKMGLLITLPRSTTRGRGSNIYYLRVGAKPDLSLRSQQTVKLTGVNGAQLEAVLAEAERQVLSLGNPANGQSDRCAGEGGEVPVTGDRWYRSALTGYKEIHQMNHQPPDLTRPVASTDPESGPVGSGTDPEDQGVAAVIAASPLAVTAPPAEPGDPVAPAVARPVGANTGDGVPGAGSGGRSAPAGARTAPAAASGAQGAREPRRSPSGESESGGRSGGSGSDLALLGACLPEWALAMDARGARQVAALLAERVGGGWRPGEIRALMGEPPAGGARRMSALVAYRLRENVIPGSAPARAGETAREAAERRAAERREATERAREAARSPEERAWDAAYARAWSEAQEELPGASRLEAAEWAAERARAVLAAGAVGVGA